MTPNTPIEPGTPVQDDPQRRLRQTWDYIRGKNSRFTRTFEDFAVDMADDRKRQQTYKWLRENNAAFVVPYERFSMDLLGPAKAPEGSKKKDEVDATLSSNLPESPTSPEPLVQEPSASSLLPPPDQTASVISNNFDVDLAKLAQLDPTKITGSQVPLEQQQRASFDYDRENIRQFVTETEKRLRPEDYPEQNPSKSFGKSIWNVLANQLPSSIAGTLAAISETPPMMSGTPPLTKYDKELAVVNKKNLLQYAQSQQRESAEYTKHLVSTLDKVNDPIDALNYVFNAAGQATGQIPLSVATGGASSAVQEIGSIYLASVENIAKDKGITVNDVIDQGLDEPGFSLAYGVTAGILDRIGAGKVMQSFTGQAFKKSLQGRAKMIASSSGVEGLTEYAQTALEQIGAEQGAGKSFTQSLTETLSDPKKSKERIEGLVQGIIGGTTLSGAGMAYGAARERIAKPETKPKTDEAQTTPAGESTKDVEAEQKERKKVLLNALLETEDVDKSFETAGYSNNEGFWVEPGAERQFNQLSPETKAILKKNGIRFIGNGNRKDVAGAAGGLKVSDQPTIRGIHLTDHGEHYSGHDKTAVHEVAHSVWQDLDDDVKQLFNDGNPVTDHGKEVQKGGDRYKAVYGDKGEQIGEEDFAELFALNKGDLNKTIADKRAQGKTVAEKPPAKDVSPEQSFTDRKGKKFTVIGKNSSGETIGEDEHGVRARLTGENGNVIVTEAVGIITSTSGVEYQFGDHEGEFLTDEEERAMKANEGTDDDAPDTDVTSTDQDADDEQDSLELKAADEFKKGDIIVDDKGREFEVGKTNTIKDKSGKTLPAEVELKDVATGTTSFEGIHPTRMGGKRKVYRKKEDDTKPTLDEKTTPPSTGKTVPGAQVSEDTAQKGSPDQAPQKPAEKIPAGQQPRDTDGGAPDPGGQYIADVEPRLGTEDLNKIGLRKIAEKHGITDDRQIKELTEVAITNRARAIAKGENAYEKLVELYEKQPTLAHRTSESIAKQQYSTPIPIAYLGGKYINADKVGKTFEPSAGNGMLTIVADPKNVTVNEIDDLRGQNLSRQGFAKVMKQDAIKPFGMDKQFDAIITNPPFGGTDVVTIDGYKFNELAQIMSVRALEAMKDNGKGAIIIGGNNEYDEKGRLTGRDRLYFNYLYNRYNVEDVIDISGDLYRKQGASFPIRLILINGRKGTPSGVAPLRDKFGRKVTDFAALEERVSKLFSEPNITSDEDTNLQPTQLAGGTATDPRGRSARDEGQTPVTSAQGSVEGQVPQTSGDSDSGGTKTGGVGGRPIGSEPASGGLAGDSGLDPELGSLSQPDADEGRSEGDIDNGPKDAASTVRRDKPRTDRKIVEGALSEQSGSVDYQPSSKGKTMNVKIPSSMAQEMYDAIARVRDEVGDIDAYVQKKLHYKTPKAMYDALGAEQIDGVAMAIWNIENGDALIIGDQTGIGKGRQAAAIVRYANYNGYKPIFLTEKPNLFGAIYRDLKAIGHGHILPFMVNNIGEKFSGVRDKDEGGNVIHKAYPSGHPQHKKVLESLKVPDDAQLVLATYSQFSNEKAYAKINFLKAVAQNNIIILDESHNASGEESNTGEVFQDIIPKAKGVVYLSGTYAKRPHNMTVYALKTAMKEANMETDELIDAIANGGAALQEIMSSQLAEAGQIVRRQRSLEDISVINNVLSASGPEHVKAADTITDLVREIILFQKRYVRKKVAEMDDDIANMATDTRVEQRKGTQDAGVDNQPYFSRVFNVIDQMLYSLKAKETAAEVIRLLKEGKKPFVAIRGTLESALNDLIDTGDVSYGDTVEADFSYLMQKGLNGVLRITIKNPDGSKTHESIKPSELGPTGHAEYNRITEKIKAATSGLSISPIDELVQTIEEAGYTVGEVTGRQTKLRLSKGKKKVGILERKKREPVDKAYIKYNSGEYDVIVVNSSGSTGEDAHADAKFKDKRVRVQLVLQPELNINTLVQILGRVNRTGQVVNPEYQFVNSVIPAEQRLMSMTMRKLKSLDANTTSNQKQSKGILDVPDFFNKYGDRIVVEYLQENPEIIELIDDPLKMLHDEDLEPTKKKDAALRVSGRIAILPVKEQEKFYNEIVERYHKQIEYLNEAGINDLEVSNLPLQAKTLSRTVTAAGKGGKSAFGDDTYLEEVEVNVLRKPMTRAEIDHHIQTLGQGKEPKNFVGELFERLQEYQEKLMGILDEEANAALADELTAAEERVKAKSKRNENALEQYVSQDLSRLEELKEVVTLANRAKLEKRKKTEAQRLEYVKSLLRFFTPGRAVRVPASLKEGKDSTTMFFSDGIFLGFDIDLTKAKPFLPSNIRLKFAVNDSRVSIPIPASKTNEINYIRTAAYEIHPDKVKAIQQWDDLKKQKGREKRMMVTGNILQGLKKYDGKIIKYTTDEGFVQTGLLLPDGFDVKEAEEAKTVSVPATKVIKMIRDSSRYTDFKLNSEGSVTLTNKGGGVFAMRVPQAKTRGGKYYLNPELLDLIDGNNFNSVGQFMEATFPSERLAMVLDLMQNKFGASVEMDKRAFEKALADQTIEMTKRSEDTFEPVAQLSLFPWLTPSKIKKKPVNQVAEDALRADIELKNKEAEERYRAAGGPSPSSKSGLWEKLSGDIKDTLTGFTSHNKYLDPRKFPREAAMLRVFETIKKSTNERAKQYMRGLIEPLTKEQFDIVTRQITLEDLLGGIEEGLEVEDNLPFGLTSKKEIEMEIQKFSDLMVKEPTAQEAYDRRQAFMKNLQEALVNRGILNRDSVKKATYYHRRTLEYLAKDPEGGDIVHGKRLSKAMKDWRRARHGSHGKDYSTNFVESEYRVVAEGLYELEKQRILEELMAPYEAMLNSLKKRFNREFQERVQDAEDQFGKGSDEVQMLKANKRSLQRTYIEENAPEGYVYYQPTPGNAMFLQKMVTEHEVERALEKAAIADQTGFGTALQIVENLADMADNYLLVGQKRKSYLVPKALADELEYMAHPQESSGIGRLAEGITGVWKPFVLLNPNRALRYNINNGVGDIDGALAADPTILKKVKQAWHELRDFERYGRSTPELNEAIRQNVIDSGWMINELQDINNVKWVRLFTDQTNLALPEAFGVKAVKEVSHVLLTAPRNIWRTYWDFTKKWTRIRENVLRYAAYLRAKEKGENGETFYWASDAVQIDGISPGEYRWGKLAREVLVDYGNISITGQRLRRLMIPFYSFQEGTMKRYYNLLRNASSPKVQARILGIAAKRGMTAVTFRMLYAYALMALFTALVSAWNWLMFPDEWERLRRANVRGLQLIVNSDKETGKVVTIPIVGALFDAVDFFGLPDILADDMALIFTGEAPMKGVVGAGKKLLVAPFNRLTQSLNPFLKSAFEMGTGQSFYPNITNPRPIYDYGEYIATFMSATDEYRAWTGTPTREPYFFGHVRNLIVRDLDPDELSYYMAKRIIGEFKGEHKYSKPANEQAQMKSEALYRYGLAVRFGRDEEAQRYLNEYYSHGGNPLSLMQSLRAKNPLNQLNARERYDIDQMIDNSSYRPETEFAKTLTSKELAIFKDAINYYERTYDPRVAPRTLNP